MSNETDNAMNNMLNGDESTNEVETQESNTEELTTQNEEESADEKTTEFSKEYVKGLREESAKYRVEAKETKTALEELKETSKKELAAKDKELADAQSALTRYKIATKYGISEDHMELFLTASDEETLEKQAAALAERTVKTPKPDRAQGKRNGSGSTSNADAFFGALGL